MSQISLMIFDVMDLDEKSSLVDINQNALDPFEKSMFAHMSDVVLQRPASRHLNYLLTAFFSECQVEEELVVDGALTCRDSVRPAGCGAGKEPSCTDNSAAVVEVTDGAEEPVDKIPAAVTDHTIPAHVGGTLDPISDAVVQCEASSSGIVVVSDSDSDIPRADFVSAVVEQDLAQIKNTKELADPPCDSDNVGADKGDGQELVVHYESLADVKHLQVPSVENDLALKSPAASSAKKRRKRRLSRWTKARVRKTENLSSSSGGNRSSSDLLKQSKPCSVHLRRLSESDCMQFGSSQTKAACVLKSLTSKSSLSFKIPKTVSNWIKKWPKQFVRGHPATYQASQPLQIVTEGRGRPLETVVTATSGASLSQATVPKATEELGNNKDGISETVPEADCLPDSSTSSPEPSAVPTHSRKDSGYLSGDVTEAVGDDEVEVLVVREDEPASSRSASDDGLVHFVSADPAENRDNEAPEWEYLKKLSTDDERYKYVRERWRNIDIPDPHRNLTNAAYIRKRVKQRLARAIGQSRHRAGSVASSGRGLKRHHSCSSLVSRSVRLKERRVVPCTFAYTKAKNGLRCGHSNLVDQLQLSPYREELVTLNRYLDDNRCLGWQVRMAAVQRLQQQQLDRIMTEHVRRAGERRRVLDRAASETRLFFRFYANLSNGDGLEDADFLTEKQRDEVEAVQQSFELADSVYGRCLDEDI